VSKSKWLNIPLQKQATKENKNSEGEENEKPKAILMAEDLKNNNNNKPSLHRNAIWPFESVVTRLETIYFLDITSVAAND
jgi:hypothetical protein